VGARGNVVGIYGYMCEGRTCIITEKMMGANALLEKIIANAIGFLERERDPFSSLECLQESSRIFFGSSFWYTSLCPSHLVWAWNEMTVKWELKRIFEKTTLEKKGQVNAKFRGTGKTPLFGRTGEMGAKTGKKDGSRRYDFSKDRSEVLLEMGDARWAY
jgi:hypothetical protein